MPCGKIHIIYGAIAAALVFAIAYFFKLYPVDKFTPAIYGIAILIWWVYSQLPDVDADTSVINKYIYTAVAFSIVYAVVQKVYLIAYVAAAIIVILEWIKHRGFTHTITFGVLMSIPLYIYNPFLGILAAACFMSHLILDRDFRIWDEQK